MAVSAFVRTLHAVAAVSAVALFGSADGPIVVNTATVAEPRTADAWKKRHEALVERSKKGNVDLLFAGDSLTQRWETDGKSVWDESFADWKAANLGIGGDRTQNLLWRISVGKELVGIEPKVIVLLIGTNNLADNSPAEIAEGVKAILSEFRKQKPKAEILLLGLFPRSGQPISESINIAPVEALNPKVAAVNELLAKLEDDSAVTFLDIGAKFLDDKGNLPQKMMPDYLHLSEEGYKAWAMAIEKPVGDLKAGRPSTKRQVKAAWRRVDARREHLMMWVSVARP